MLRLLVSIEISETRLKKIGWDLCHYADDPPTEDECKDWLEDAIQHTIEELPLPPEIS